MARFERHFGFVSNSFEFDYDSDTSMNEISFFEPNPSRSVGLHLML